MPDLHLLAYQCLFFGSHLVWPFIVWSIWRYRKLRRSQRGHRRDSRLGKFGLAARLLIAFTFVWARFVEPNWIVESNTTISLGGSTARPTRIALISDAHQGTYKDAAFLQRVVDKLNQQELDCVLIAGDHLYGTSQSLEQLFAPYKTLRHRAYVVNGNHDSTELMQHGQHRPVASEAVRRVTAALAQANLPLIENQIVDCGGFAIAGIGDRWSGEEDVRHIQAYRGSKPLIALTHNPDTHDKLRDTSVKLLLAGHTHGGQIRIPWLYKLVLPVRGPFDRGLHAPPLLSHGPPVFVTSGLGETALPFRLFNPPVIDLLTLWDRP